MSARLFKSVTMACLALFLITGVGTYTVYSFPSRPLSKADILALVAGQVVPENIAFEIRSRGLTFAPDLAFSGLLKQAGADARVFAALSSAKILPAASSASEETPELLRHLTNAGKFARHNSLDEAAEELSLAMSATSAKSRLVLSWATCSFGKTKPKKR